MGRAGGGGHDLGCVLPHRRADVAVCWRHAYVEEHTLKALRAAPHVLHFLSAMAAILSPFLLFLMALALRLKFRMSV
jgi:hypothetical protein